MEIKKNLSADQKASALTEKALRRASVVSFGVSSLVLLIKFAAYYLTHSQAVLSDALESIVNVLAALVALVLMKLTLEPADEEHPYGHGKIEYFSAAFEGGLISFAAAVIGYEAVAALVRGEVAHRLEEGVIYVIVATLINLLLGLYLKHIGKKHHSEAMLASGTHVMTDVWTTLAVAVGLGVVYWTGWQWVDPLVALLVAFHLAANGFMIVRRSMSGLLDEMDHESLTKLSVAFQKNLEPGLIDIHHLRTIRSGRFHHIDAHLVVPEFWDVEKTHMVTHQFEARVVNDYPFDGEIAFHIDPCQRKFCTRCDLQSCNVRARKFQMRSGLDVKALIAGPVKDQGGASLSSNENEKRK